MMKKVRLVPAVLAHDIGQFTEKIKQLENFFTTAQLDVMDGKFVKNKTLNDPEKIFKVKTQLSYQLHLMVQNPPEMIKKWLEYPKAEEVIVHYKTLKNAKQLIWLIEYVKIKKRKKIGLAINPETDYKVLSTCWEILDYVLVMGVKPGKSGQNFLPKTYRKIKKIKELCPRLKIGVDGGVNHKNLEKLINLDVEMITAASLFFKYRTLKENIEKIKKIKNVKFEL